MIAGIVGAGIAEIAGFAEFDEKSVVHLNAGIPLRLGAVTFEFEGSKRRADRRPSRRTRGASTVGGQEHAAGENPLQQLVRGPGSFGRRGSAAGGVVEGVGRRGGG